MGVEIKVLSFGALPKGSCRQRPRCWSPFLGTWTKRIEPLLGNLCCWSGMASCRKCYNWYRCTWTNDFLSIKKSPTCVISSWRSRRWFEIFLSISLPQEKPKLKISLSPRGENFLGRLGTLRALLGREGAQAAVRKAPYLLLEENQFLVLKWAVALDPVWLVIVT